MSSLIQHLEPRQLLAAVTDSSGPSELFAAGAALYFSADDGVHGDELFKSDGTAAGTVLVRDVTPGGVGSNPRQFVSNGGRDRMFGNGGNDRLYGGASGDWIYGQAGNDQIVGEGGNDRLYGDDAPPGADTLRGGAGDDVFITLDGVIDELFGDGGDDSANADADDVLTSIAATT